MRRRNLAALTEQAQHELRKISSSRKRDLVEERLRCEAEPVGAGGAQRTGSHDGRQHGLAVMKVLDESGRRHRNVEARGPGRSLAITKGHEVIAERDEVTVRADARLETVPPSGTVVIAADIVLARPDELNRSARNRFRNRRSLYHVVVHYPEAETAPGTCQMQGNSVGRDAEGVVERLQSPLRCLAGRPDLESAFFVARRAVLRFHGRMRN